jgi:hypothetical protein
VIQPVDLALLKGLAGRHECGVLVERPGGARSGSGQYDQGGSPYAPGPSSLGGQGLAMQRSQDPAPFAVVRSVEILSRLIAAVMLRPLMGL